MSGQNGLIDPQVAVDQLLGEGKAQVIEAATSTRVTETEVVLINGTPVQLVGVDGASLREALLAGRLPDQGLLNKVLLSVLGGELKGVTKIESQVNVTSKLTSRDTLSVLREGKVVDERTQEYKSDSASMGRRCERFTPTVSFSRQYADSSTPIFSPSPQSLSRNTPSPSFCRKYTSDGPSSANSSSDTLPQQNIPSSRTREFSPLDLNSSGISSSSSRKIQSGVCLSPDLEESLARTSIKDPTGIRKKDFEILTAHGRKATINDPLYREIERKNISDESKSSSGSTDISNSASRPHRWALDDDEENSLLYESGILISGSLDALILHATPTKSYYPDAAYLFAFLLSARLFIRPHELLDKICSLGFGQQGLVKVPGTSPGARGTQGNFVPYMVQLLGEWSETFPYDFRDERMMAGVRNLTHRCISLHPSLRRDVTQVLHNLLNKLTQLERYEEALSKHPSQGHVTSSETVPDITEACSSPLILAQQLTHIELERLSYIGPEEFVQAFAKDNLEANCEDMKRTNNLESYVQWFNRLSYLVATQACTPTKKKHRIRVIETWIEVARECFNIGNFNSLMGIIAGLNMAPVARLKKTWNKIHTAKFSILEHQMDPSSNFSSYRSTLKAAVWRSAGAVDGRLKIVIPFFSLLVKDLYFINEGCANRLANGYINFEKFWQLAKQVTEFMSWKEVTCPFDKVLHVISYLQTTPVLTESGLALVSFENEGPENNFERERLKSLKLEYQTVP